MVRYQWIGIVFIATIMIYLPLLNAQFLNWDDQNHIIKNQATMALDIDHIKIAFTQELQKVYMPLTTLVWTLERVIFGLNPTVFHLTNIFIHALNACLVGVLAMRLGVLPFGAMMAALLFACHPMRVESVAWITETKDVLCALFYLMALIQWVDYRQHHARWSYISAIICAILSLLAKPMAISLPITMLVMDWLMTGKIRRAFIIDKIVFILLSIAIGWITYQHHVRYPLNDISSNVIIFCYTIIFYPIKFIFPVNLTPIYTLPEPIIWANPIYLLSVVGVLVLWGLMFFYRRQHWFIGSVLFWVGSMFFLYRYDNSHDINIVADRFIYIPSILACIACGYWMQDGKLIKKIGGLTIIAVFAFLSFKQSMYWHDSVTLFTHAIQLNPRNTIALNDRGGAYHELKKYDLAIKDYNRILVIKPNDSDTLMNRALSYQAKGEYTQAIHDFNDVLFVYPGYARGYLQRGISFMKLELYQQALVDFSKAIQITPDYAEAYFNRGLVYLKQGQQEEALKAFNQAIVYKPTLLSAFNNRGVLLARLKAYELAKKDFNRVLSQDPTNEEALYNLKVIRILEEAKTLTPQQVR